MVQAADEGLQFLVGDQVLHNISSMDVDHALNLFSGSAISNWQVSIIQLRIVCQSASVASTKSLLLEGQNVISRSSDSSGARGHPRRCRIKGTLLDPCLASVSTKAVKMSSM